MSESNHPNVVIVENAIVGSFRIRRNRIIAKVNNVNTIMTSAEFERLRHEGYDLEAIGSECETGA
ncbi:MAG: hypothetical protein ABSC20_09670 [Candidatus Bathyarchaeia archaeon]